MSKQILIAEATFEQLRAYANGTLGLGLPVHTKPETLISRIKQASNQDFIAVEDEADAPKAVQPLPGSAPPAPPVIAENPRALRGGSSKNDPLVTLIISEQEGQNGKRDVFVGVNGVGMCIPRNKPVKVPYRYYLALMDARMATYEQDEKTHEILESNAPTYNFQVVESPSPAEIAAWNKSQGIGEPAAA
jgi:hypothetical protein